MITLKVTVSNAQFSRNTLKQIADGFREFNAQEGQGRSTISFLSYNAQSDKKLIDFQFFIEYLSLDTCKQLIGTTLFRVLKDKPEFKFMVVSYNYNIVEHNTLFCTEEELNLNLEEKNRKAFAR